MISLKSFEIRTGKKIWILSKLNNLNTFIQSISDFIKKVFSFISKRSAIALIQWIAYYILSWVRELYIWAHKKAHSHPPSKKVIDMVRGRGQIKRNGGISFYLRRISGEDEEEEIKK